MEHVAIDLGLRESQICVRDAEGKILEERRHATAALDSYLARRPPSRVIVESSAEAFAVADLARRYGHEVRVVPSLLVRTLGVGARGIKNDRNDARATSRASCQIDLPSVHIPSAMARELKAVTTSREGCVEARTKLVNMVRSYLRGQLIAMKRGATETFPARVRERLLQTTAGLPEHIERVLKVLEELNRQVAEADKELERLAKESPVCRRLMTMPGVGPVTAVRFAAAVDEVGRFPDAHQLESYFGLVPGENVTGFQGHHTHLTKAGSTKVRWTLVQAAWCAMRTRPFDPMVLWAAQIAKRRGRSVAAVALARKMAGILYAMWRHGSNYDPRRGATKTTDDVGTSPAPVANQLVAPLATAPGQPDVPTPPSEESGDHWPHTA